MKFKCRNCGKGFIKNIYGDLDLIYAKCPECGSNLIIQIGVGIEK